VKKNSLTPLRYAFVKRIVCVLVALVPVAPGAVSEEAQVDTALIVAVDVSSSVDADRYKLQMEGIAKALEDPGVIQAIAGGPNGGILFSMVTWADRPSIALPWVRIANKEDALAVAQRVRKLPLQSGEFTCMTRMLRSANDKIVPQIPAKALRVVIDVSGDGPDNCNADEPIETVRDELVANGVTINGLPILEGANASAPAPAAGAALADTVLTGPALETWFKSKVVGGNGNFVLPANGYGDFGRAIRQKFVIEISGNAPLQRYGALSVGDSLVEIQGLAEPDHGRLAPKL
jgi:Protein of unknown function (DUF1194)